ncbi:hypothetical protein CTAYLR_001971 [Chrysophaeum taylorii]|uniref:EIPR1-like beta-propeller domain-containing protein n=1 Tax=Chrysophaeum taylorii TaxID=2483200 RepID=A0AAD7U9C1_9STRA|nr:hypothetical protein CTAYLR_001971 [Chrysophaeum taylorii]
MFSTSSTVYTAKYQARALAAVVGDPSRHRFMVGTCSVREENVIEVIDFDEESNALSCVGSIQHPAEVVCVSPSPYDATLLVTCGATAEGCETRLWSCDVSGWGARPRYDDDDDDDDDHNIAPPQDGWAHRGESAGVGSLTPRTNLGNARTPCAVWCPKEHDRPRALATIDESSLFVWDVESGEHSRLEVARPTAAAWSPHAADEIAVAGVVDVRVFDARLKTPAKHVESPHDGACLDVDYNPNKPFCLATSGDDGCVKFWDTRADAPLKILSGGHSHWVTNVKYNRFHDQLLVSAGTDRLVNLWRVSSISSAPLLELGDTPADDDDDDDEPRGGATDDDDDDDDLDVPERPSTEATAADVCVRTFDLHDDSVYSLAWSACNAWAFTSLSYDGRVVLNHVPSPEKYKILL